MAISKLLSPNYTPGRSFQPIWVVIHSMEVDYRPGVAGAVASYFSRETTQASAHVCVDGGDVVTCVEDEDTAWAAARTGNRRGLHLELAGRAAEGRDVWLSRAPMLDLAANWVAQRATKFAIPLVFRSAAELTGFAPGITTHREISFAFGETDHTDPGAGFPMDDFISRVAVAMGQPPRIDAVPAWSGRVLRLAEPMMTGADIATMQAQLVTLGFSPGPADGVFGPRTDAAVRAFQQSRFGKTNGMVGAFTWNAMFTRRSRDGAAVGSIEDDERAARRDATEKPHPAHEGHVDLDAVTDSSAIRQS